MKVIFTICSNNYLGQALALRESLQQTNREWKFVIGLVDKPSNIDLNESADTILPVDRIEPSILLLAEKFNIIELNTAVKPRFFEYFLLEEKAEQVVYLDPDIYVFQPFNLLSELLRQYDFLLTPHILSPLPMDVHKPSENLFLNYGLYNLGFFAVRNNANTLRLIQWWKARTFELGFDRTPDGLFTDQLWLNFAPILFEDGLVIKDPSWNMGPWNIHERYLSGPATSPIVNQDLPLTFYHFSGFTPGKQRFHWDYDRFAWGDREDLQELYLYYSKALDRNSYHKFREIPCWYVNYRKQHLEALKLLQIETERRDMLAQPPTKRIFGAIKSRVPKNIRRAVHAFRNSKPVQ